MKIFRFVKKVFSIGLTIVSNLVSTNSLSCTNSMNNQPCKARPEIINILVIILYFIHSALKLNAVAIVIILMIHT